MSLGPILASTSAYPKQNHSPQYSIMLLSGALVRLLELSDRDVLKLSAALLHEQIPVVLTQIINQTLLHSGAGSWDAKESPENAAYGILTLATVVTIPWIAPLKEQVNFTIEEGQRFLLSAQGDWDKPQLLWIEKVTYGSRRLSEAYCLAAMRPSISPHAWSEKTINLVNISEKSIFKFPRLVASLTDFRDEPLWRLKASTIEGFAFLPLLKSARMDILPRQKGAKNEYLDFIPCTWVLINNSKRLFLQANLLWDMMVLTMCNFRVDEYMETVVATLGVDRLGPIKSIIRTLCVGETMDVFQGREKPHEDSVRATNDTVHLVEKNKIRTSDLGSFQAIIGHYINAMLDYPRLQRASLVDQGHLRSELQTFLLSHITQTEDNARFSAQEPQSQSTIAVFVSAQKPFYEWAHTTGADSVSCPFSFAFFTCLLGSSLSSSPYRADCFSSIHETYLARDLCNHLAVMSRLYNDFGSLARDRAEANVNSTNFPEFHGTTSHGYSIPNGEERPAMKEAQLKADLLTLARHERESADSVGHRLIEKLRVSGSSRGRSKADGITLFMGVTALYADMYVARDLSNHIQKAQ